MTPAEQRLKQCPFCGSTDLITGSWCIDDDEAHELVKAGDLGEVPIIECNRCLGSAPAEIWNNRPDPWRYPPDMPAPGRVLMTYRQTDGKESPPVLHTVCDPEVLEMQPIVRWMAIQEVG
jgi:hypothetical protein